MNIINISVTGATAVDVKYPNLLRSAVTVVSQTGSGQFSKIHCYTDITIRKCFAGDTGIVSGFTGSIKVEVAVYALDPCVQISQNQTNRAVICQLIVKDQAFISIFFQIDDLSFITGKCFTTNFFLRYILNSGNMVLIHSAQKSLKIGIVRLAVHTANVIQRTVGHIHFCIAVCYIQYNFFCIILRINPINLNTVQTVFPNRIIAGAESVVCNIAGNSKIVPHSNL